MLNRAKRILANAGRYRQALFVVVIAGSTLNLWQAIDAQLSMPKYATYLEEATKRATSDVTEAAKLNNSLVAYIRAKCQVDRKWASQPEESTTDGRPACSDAALGIGPDELKYSTDEGIQQAIRDEAAGFADADYESAMEWAKPRLMHTWDRVAKIELALLASALCVWLILPASVAKASPRAPG